MSSIIHFTDEIGAWRYLLPALFDLNEFLFDWEFCRFPGGIELADELLSDDRRQIFSPIDPAHKQYVSKWLGLNGLPSPEIPMYFWSTTQEDFLGLPCIHLPMMLDEQNDFIVGIKSRYPSISLVELCYERSLDIRKRQYLSKLLSPALAQCLANQFNSLSIAPTPQSKVRSNFPSNTPTPPPRVRSSSPPIAPTTQPKVQNIPYWAASFENNEHLAILLHIDRHDVITEAEVNKLLGSARLARKFTNSIDEYSSMLPFSIQVQASEAGMRYLKNLY
jgi:hypothetical protein